MSLNLGGFRDPHEPGLTFYSTKLSPGIRLLLANLNALSKRLWSLFTEGLSSQPRVLDLPLGHRTHTPEHQHRLGSSRRPRKGVSRGLAAGGSRGCPLGAGAWLSRVALILRLQRRDFKLVCFLLSTLPRFFQDLLDPARWRMLIQQFRYDNYRLHQLGNNSVFTLTLQAGLSAIKTPYPSLRECSPRAPSSAGLASRPRSLPALAPVLETSAVPPAPQTVP